MLAHACGDDAGSIPHHHQGPSRPVFCGIPTLQLSRHRRRRKRGLYHTMLNKYTSDEVMLRTNILAYADGQHSVADMAELFGESQDLISTMVLELKQHGLIEEHLQSNQLQPGRPN